MQKAINFNDVAFVSVKGSDYRIHFWYMSKHNAISIMKNSDLNKKSDYNFFLSKYKKKWVPVIKEIKKNNQNKPKNTTKMTKKDCKSKQERNTENYREI